MNSRLSVDMLYAFTIDRFLDTDHSLEQVPLHCGGTTHTMMPSTLSDPKARFRRMESTPDGLGRMPPPLPHRYHCLQTGPDR